MFCTKMYYVAIHAFLHLNKKNTQNNSVNKKAALKHDAAATVLHPGYGVLQVIRP